MFGSVPPLQVLAVVGAALLMLLSVQIALGMRWIKLKGRTHWRVHKWLAWTIFAIAVVHGVIGLAVASGVGL